MALTTPIAFIAFNRPRHTLKTFESIRAQQPTELFLISDGPRPRHPTDTENCHHVREILAGVDWPCTVHRNYSDVNMGCKARVISGLNWVFEKVDRAIILEDDCLPNDDFYPFCQELLERYRDDARVMTITGNNFQDGQLRGDDSYYFSKYNHIWGWATWRRAWQKNDPTLSFWPTWKISSDWVTHSPDHLERAHWSGIFDQMYRNEIDTWDYPWTANIWYHGGLIATPNVNLVTNIGFGPDGTHTVSYQDEEGIATHSLQWPLHHPHQVSQNTQADRYVYDHLLGGIYKRFPQALLYLPARIYRKMVRTLKQILNARSTGGQ